MYKIEITEIPAECDELRIVMCDDGFLRMTRDWKPEGWEEYVAERIADGANWEPDQHFFWPSENKMYLSRSSAQEKVDIVERWGGKARLLEAELSEFIPVEEANQRRKRARNAKTVERLRARIAELEG
jgi:hypothetical protein